MNDRQSQPLSIAAFTRAYRKPMHPAVANARQVMEDDQRQREAGLRRIDVQVERELNRIWRAVMLSPDLETCEALLEGKKVPVNRLDPNWLARFPRP